MPRHSKNRLPGNAATKGGALALFLGRRCGGVLKRRHWIFLGGVICALLGGFYGHRMEECERREVDGANRAMQADAFALDKAVEVSKKKLAQFEAALGVADFNKEEAAMVQERAELDKKSEGLRVQLDGSNLEISDLLAELSKHHPALVAARQELAQALLRYTEEHLRVKKLRATLEALQAQLAESKEQITPETLADGNFLAQSLYTKLLDLRAHQVGLVKQLEAAIISRSQLCAKLKRLSEARPEYLVLRTDCNTLQRATDALHQRQQEARAAAARRAPPPAFAWILPGQLGESSELFAALRSSLEAGILGICLAGVVVAGLGITQRRIWSASDLELATELPLLATLGDLRKMSREEQDEWAFSTLMALRASLTQCGRDALVCGFISAAHGEGCSTWVQLLAAAAKRCGFRVLSLSASEAVSGNSLPQHTSAHPGESPNGDSLPAPPAIASALMSSECETALIPLTGWAWNVEHRQRWQSAVRHWKSLENTAVFLDLPPASHPEAILLSEELSSVIWLCGKGMADISDTRCRLKTLRDVRSNVVGAVFNNRGGRSRKRNGHLVSMCCALTCFSATAWAQEARPQPETAPPIDKITPAFSVSSPAQLADWQKHLTLGAGDTLNLSLYEQPDSERKDMIIGPDGRLNYLQARDVMAAGLTVDELRTELEKLLAKYYRPPLRVIVVPQAYRSKKYYLLGNVVQKGVFPLDRPVTILEAIAQAQGFVTTTERRSTLTLADLQRAFLIRKGEKEEHQRLKVDFEALFLQGDLSQNIPLAPGDYLYFPPPDLQEVYVLGEVPHPGITAYSSEMTVLRAIASHGGFGDRAFRQRVLIVRGSLNHPQTLVLNVSDILKAKGVDVHVEPRDIIYVSRRPWYKAEELLQAAVSDFLRAAVVAWTGKNIQPLIQ